MLNLKKRSLSEGNGRTQRGHICPNFETDRQGFQQCKLASTKQKPTT